MGASGWRYYCRAGVDPTEMLAQLHREQFADPGTYYWADESVPRPKDLAGLHALYMDEENETLATDGTHSILDVYLVLPPGSPDEYGAIMELEPAARDRWFPGRQPTREDFEALHGTGELDNFPRWSGRYTTLYRDGQPYEYAVWGFSGD